MKANIDMSNRRIHFNLPAPIGPNQPATKSFVENKINDYVKKDGTTAMTSNLQMGSKKITNLADPDQDNEAVNKGYLDQKVTNAYLTAYLKKDGSQSMTGNLLMGDHTITGIRSSSQDNASLTVGGAKSLFLPLAGNKGMEGALNMAKNSIINLKMPSNPADECAINLKYFNDRVLNRKSTQKMEADLDMVDNNIINLKDPLPSNSQYAASDNFVNKSISDNNASVSKTIDCKIIEAEKLNIKSSTQNNAFLFVMGDDLFKEDDDDITKVGKVDKDFYQIEKETYQFTIKFDSSIKCYITRLSIDLISSPLGEYTLVFEMYYSDKTNQNQVTVSATSGSLTVS